MGKLPEIDKSAYIAPSATICGDVKIGKNARIMFNASVIAEGGSIEIGDNCVILEGAVIRSTLKHSLTIGNDVLIGPHAHLVGCTVEDNVFIATGASIFHGAKLCRGSEVRINGVVHIKTVLPENGAVPIGCVALGSPVQILPAEKQDEISSILRTLNFPEFVYGVSRDLDGESIMPKITKMMTEALQSHQNDQIIE